MALLTYEDLRRLLDYDPATGILSWKTHPLGKYITPGQPTGLTPCQAHKKLSILSRRYYVHRVIWFWMTGDWPNGLIDHKDRNPSNNVWTNLRLATPLQNTGNTKRKKGTVGLKGVIRSGPKFTAQISIDRRSTHLGTFDCPAAAHFIYLVAADKRFGEFACRG